MTLSNLMSPPVRRLHEIVERQSLANGERTALTEGARQVSYRELHGLIDQLKRYLCDAGLRAGDRLLLVGENCILQVAAVFAASQIDACAVIVNARLTASEIDAIRAHCQPRMALYTTDISPEVLAHAQHRKAPVHEVNGLGRFALDLADEKSEPDPVHEAADQQPAVIIYTTGTTGSPKGVMLTHANLLFSCGSSSRSRFTTEQDDIYAALPISHVYGLTSVTLAGLYAGARVRMVARFSAQDAADALADGVTIFQGVPIMYVQLLRRHEEISPVHVPKLRFLYIGGAPLDDALKGRVEAMLGLVLHNGYGMTETSPTVSQIPFGATRADTSVGYLVPGVSARIVDKSGTDIKAGGVGELWVRGPNVMKGYYREPELTAATLNADGWLKTGDLMRQDPDGALYLVGRIKELIIRSGFNVYPAEVEGVINAYPQIQQSAVVSKAVDSNEEVIAFVQVENTNALDLDALNAYLKLKLAPYKRPQQIIAMTQLPQTASGKILKHELKARL